MRHSHMEEIVETKPTCHWFEIIAEAFAFVGGRDAELLSQIQKDYPVVAHGVGLSVGSTDPLNFSYLKGLKAFLDRINSPWYSDHLCFTMVDHININELVPLPFTKEAARNCIDRIRIIQNYLERPFLIENVTRYMTVSDSEMSETEFINIILDQADCGLLLDVTNVYLNSQIHHFDPIQFIKSLPLRRVGQMHLAGWESRVDGEILDSHDGPIPMEVYDLFAETIKLVGPSSVVVEWDRKLPPLSMLVAEARVVDEIMSDSMNKDQGSNVLA